MISASRDELRDATQFYSRIALRDHPPLMIDTLDSAVMEQVLQLCGASCYLNSASLKNEPQLESVCGLAREYQAKIVVACRDRLGLAITRHQKVEIAMRTLDRMGMPPESVIIDLLAFPAATFPEGLPESIAAIDLIHEALPGVSTLLALSNFSFGMPASQRTTIEERILQDCTAAGLNFVILNTCRHQIVNPLSHR